MVHVIRVQSPTHIIDCGRQAGRSWTGTIEHMLGEVSDSRCSSRMMSSVFEGRGEVVRILQAQSVAGISLGRKDLV